MLPVSLASGGAPPGLQGFLPRGLHPFAGRHENGGQVARNVADVTGQVVLGLDMLQVSLTLTAMTLHKFTEILPIRGRRW